jgi:hypothetical protein
VGPIFSIAQVIAFRRESLILSAERKLQHSNTEMKYLRLMLLIADMIQDQTISWGTINLYIMLGMI